MRRQARDLGADCWCCRRVLVDGRIFSPPVFGARRNDSIGACKERVHGEREARNGLTRQRITHYFIGVGQVLIIELAIFVVDSEAGANDRLSLEDRRRPGNRDARIDVAIVSPAEAGSDSAKALRPARSEIEWIRAALYLMEDVEKAVTRSKI